MAVSDIIRERMIELIDESGNVPWRKAWIANGIGSMPVNIISKKAYTGVNVALLSGCTSKPIFGTFKQIAGLGCQLKDKEERSKYICVYFKPSTTKKNDDGTVERSYPMLRYYNLFNIDDMVLSDAAQTIVDKIVSGWDDSRIFNGDSDYCAVGEDLVTKLGVELRYGNPACGKGYIQIPKFNEFKTDYEFLVSLCHELGHYYQKEMELDTKEYAFNELVAEITGVFTVNQLGVEIKECEMVNSAAYVAGWRKKLVEEKGAVNQVIKACSIAQRVSDRIITLFTADMNHATLDN